MTEPVTFMTRRQVNNALIIIGIGVFAASILDPLTFLRRGEYRGEVKTLFESLQIGMTKQQVTREMDSGKYPHLRFHREGPIWLGSAPLEFGAGNWVLAIEFQNDQVSGVRVRKGDGLQDIHHPVEAPRDKVRSTGGSE